MAVIIYITTSRRAPVQKMNFFNFFYQKFGTQPPDIEEAQEYHNLGAGSNETLSKFINISRNNQVKDDSVRKFHTAMWLEDMYHQKQSTVDREKKVLEIIIEIYIKLYKQFMSRIFRLFTKASINFLKYFKTCGFVEIYC